MTPPEGISGKTETPQEKQGGLSADLCELGATGSRDAFARIFAEMAPRLRAFMLKNGLGASAAEEVLQETLLRVWRKAHLFDPEKSSASTWIHTIARNVKIDRLRKEARPEPDPEDPSFIPAAPETGEENMARKQDSALIRKAMSVLPPEQLRIITMSFYEEKSHGEIAEELGVPLGTVKSRIRLAFGKIRAEVEKMQ
ncbi:sigma-70 family RNA polymerase sigma factor [Sneathiella chinensis]|nr:sigma-70 family RNA polymerase sigma factor [Sneathiella chinensis]